MTIPSDPVIAKLLAKVPADMRAFLAVSTGGGLLVLSLVKSALGID